MVLSCVMLEGQCTSESVSYCVQSNINWNIQSILETDAVSCNPYWLGLSIGFCISLSRIICDILFTGIIITGHLEWPMTRPWTKKFWKFWFFFLGDIWSLGRRLYRKGGVIIGQSKFTDLSGHGGILCLF